METAQRAVLFVDIAGSTRIYESLGDSQALGLIGNLFGQLDKSAAEHGGVVVKKMGDGMVYLFPGAAEACDAACDMQLITQRAAASGGTARLAIRAGFNGGAMLLSDGDVFGDTVNLCARLVGLANPGQVLTTQLNVDVLPPELQARCRQLFPIRVRGREGEVVVCDVQYRSDPDLTKTNFERAALVRKRETVLKITYQGEARVVRSTGHGLRIGRDKTNDLVVDSPYASRLHVRVFAREGHFVLQDLSSNGTYLLPDGGAPEILLRREEAVLGERGWIGLGNTATQHGDHALRFRVDAEDA
ncbi:MAG: FHA domain-containing protein [Betaproteobacteria bacterium]|nr:FHA domain-containing protein [Betaproteobacteria bacterium]MDH5222616.1 FHA domain-containing protein [Betaproteobacteria bacterium]MDH5351509.1 FHA domain-containing protein [Betaproteobacteria bacterium]